MDVKLGGTSAVPDDNFRELYEKAGEAAPPAETGDAEADAPDSFESLIEGGE